jgi:hypothetical protein
MIRLLALLVGLAVTSSPIFAQRTGDARRGVCDAERKEPVTIKGRIVADSAGLPVVGRAVSLVGTNCFGVTDSLGAFRFHGVRPGEYRIAVAPLGFRPHPPVPVIVPDTSVVDAGTIRLRPENRVADCMEKESCAALLRPNAASVAELDEAERIAEAVLRLTITLAGGDWSVEHRAIPCAPDANRAVFTALRRRFRDLAPDSACILSSPAQLTDASLIHRPSGRPAWSVRVSRIERQGAAVISRSSYYVGPLHAEGWVCRLEEKQPEGWVPQWCRMEWIA